MALIKNRVKTTNSFVEVVRFALFLFKKFYTIFLIFICFIIMLFPVKIISESSLEICGKLLSSFSFVADDIIDKFKTFYERVLHLYEIEEQNLKLKVELHKTSALEELTAEVLSENSQLKKLLKVINNNIKYNYITSKIIGVNITPLSSFAVINAGKENNIKINDWVTNEKGLVGKVINVSRQYSVVMLLNDRNSRVPVITSYSRESGILAQKGNEMLLLYLSENHKIKVGELLYTSGDGKIYPYGILVGKIHKINGENISVKLAANITSNDFVVVQSIFDNNVAYLPVAEKVNFDTSLEKKL